MGINKIYIPTFISSVTYEPVRVLPHVYFFNGTKQTNNWYVEGYTDSSKNAVNGTIQSVFPYFDNYSGNTPTSESLSLLFNNETAPYGETPTGSLYTEYWETYINLLYNPRTRLINASAIIPLADYFKMELNDIVQWRGNYYHLRAINDYNLKTGETSIQLLGPIIKDTAVTAIPNCNFDFTSDVYNVSCSFDFTSSVVNLTTTTTLTPTTTLSPTTTTAAPTTTTLAPTTTTTAAPLSFEYLLVGGGGGGGSRHAGGGGGGGYLSGSATLPVGYTIQINPGGGGAGASTAGGPGTNGSDTIMYFADDSSTIFNTFFASGSGFGGGPGSENGGTGGSGGGGSAGGNGGIPIIPQGNSGSLGVVGSTATGYAGGGGGGALTAATPASPSGGANASGGNGGNGKLWFDGGSWGAGGGGGVQRNTTGTAGSAGTGGGSLIGISSVIGNATAGTKGDVNASNAPIGGGGGGGAGFFESANGRGGNGGLGISMIRYAGSTTRLSFGAGVSTYVYGGYTYHYFAGGSIVYTIIP